MQNDLKFLGRLFAKFAACTVFLALLAAAAFVGADAENMVSTEYMLVEWLQELFLLLIVLMHVWMAVKKPESRQALVLVAGFFLCLFIREFDFLLDEIRHGFWFYIAMAVCLPALVYAASALSKTVAGLAAYCRGEGFALTLSGLIIVMGFARVFGMYKLWLGTGFEGNMRLIKNLVEEGSELMAYGLMLLGSLFTVCEVRSRINAAKAAQG